MELNKYERLEISKMMAGGQNNNNNKSPAYTATELRRW